MQPKETQTVRFRKSKKIGGIRITGSRSGIGISAGVGPLRVGLGADGKVRRTVRVPGTGVHDTKAVSGGGDKPTAKEGAQRSTDRELTVQLAGEGVPVTVWQRNYVKAMLQRAHVAPMPDLRGLTTGDAETLLAALGRNPKQLYKWGRAWGQKR
jgi:hypothetical protein